MPNPTLNNANAISWMTNASEQDWRDFGNDALTYGIKTALNNRFTVSSNLQDAADIADNYDPTGKSRFRNDCHDVADRINDGWTISPIEADIYDTGITPILETKTYIQLSFSQTRNGFYVLRNVRLVVRSQ